MAEGQRLEREIRKAMGAADIRGMAALARRAGVQRDTLYAWFRGDQEPRPDTLSRVAEVLGLKLADLWHYAEDERDPLIVALERQTEAITMLAERLDRMTSPEWLAECVAASLAAVEQRLATERGESGSASVDPASSRRGPT